MVVVKIFINSPAMMFAFVKIFSLYLVGRKKSALL
ncbi:unnamed protein product, partial [Vitis vinifera]